jgi:hypothetical protein
MPDKVSIDPIVTRGNCVLGCIDNAGVEVPTFVHMKFFAVRFVNCTSVVGPNVTERIGGRVLHDKALPGLKFKELPNLAFNALPELKSKALPDLAFKTLPEFKFISLLSTKLTLVLLDICTIFVEISIEVPNINTRVLFMEDI